MPEEKSFDFCREFCDYFWRTGSCLADGLPEQCEILEKEKENDYEHNNN